MTPGELCLLEQMVDRNGLHGVFDELAKICAEKADHIRTSYGDCPTGNRWDLCAGECAVVANTTYFILEGKKR